MTFVAYFNYLNTAGKITAKSLLDTQVVVLSYVEELEKKNEEYEANFKEIESILTKLVEKKVDVDIDSPVSKEAFPCPICGKVLSSNLALAGHSRTHKSPKVV